MIRTVGKTYLTALFVVLLHFTAQIRGWAVPARRYQHFWSRGDALALVAAMLLLPLLVALVAVLLRGVTRRRQWPIADRVLDHVFLLALFSGVMALAPSRLRYGRPVLTEFLWIGALAVLGWSFGRRWRRPAAYAGRACAVLGLLAVPACAWVLSWPTWNDPPSPEALPQNGAAQKTPVFVFLFDDWSLVRSTRDGQWRPELRHLAALSHEAVVCRQAHSPSVDPTQSAPQIACQTSALLRAARERGYVTAVLGWGWPVRRTLGPLVDTWHAGQPHRAPECPGERMAAAWLRNLRSCSDPISVHVGDPLRTRQLGRRAVETQFLMARARKLIDTCPRNVLAVVHLPVPGWPFLWDADGTYRGPASEGPASAEGYRRSLGHQDRIVGQLVQHLKAAGKYDDALLVFTATRSWPGDPEPLHRQADGWMQHVPLLVKLPGQTKGCVVDGPIACHRLSPLIEAVLAGEREGPRLREMLDRASQDIPTHSRR